MRTIQKRRRTIFTAGKQRATSNTKTRGFCRHAKNRSNPKPKMHQQAHASMHMLHISRFHKSLCMIVVYVSSPIMPSSRTKRAKKENELRDAHIRCKRLMDATKWENIIERAARERERERKFVFVSHRVEVYFVFGCRNIKFLSSLVCHTFSARSLSIPF